MDSLRAFGHDVVVDLCDRLLAGGAPGIHFYTMNQAGPCAAQRLWGGGIFEQRHPDQPIEKARLPPRRACSLAIHSKKVHRLPKNVKHFRAKASVAAERD